MIQITAIICVISSSCNQSVIHPTKNVVAIGAFITANKTMKNPYDRIIAIETIVAPQNKKNEHATIAT